MLVITFKKYKRLSWLFITPTQYVVNTLYWPHTALSVYLVCYFLVPHTHVLCMGSGSATGKKIQVRLVYSLLKYFFKFQLWYWIKNLHYQIFKFVIDNSDISLNCLQHIQKRRNFDAKVTCHQPICLLLHAILSGVGVACTGMPLHWQPLCVECGRVASTDCCIHTPKLWHGYSTVGLQPVSMARQTKGI